MHGLIMCAIIPGLLIMPLLLKFISSSNSDKDRQKLYPIHKSSKIPLSRESRSKTFTIYAFSKLYIYYLMISIYSTLKYYQRSLLSPLFVKAP